MKEFEDIISTYPEFKRFYSIKKRIFPIASCVAQFPDQGTLVDLGCGNGLFAGLLAKSRPGLSILGIDDDDKKIQLANQVFGSFQNISFRKGNIVEIDYPRGDHYSLIDVLYLIPYPLQEAIIDKISNLIPVHGELIIKEMDKKPRIKYLFNMFQETLSVKILNITLGSKFYFRDTPHMIDLLEKRGFMVETVRMDRGYMHPHVLYKAKKLMAGS